MKAVMWSRLRALATVSALGFAASGLAPCQAVPGFVIAAYVFPRNTVLKPGQIDARNMTRINFAFASINNGRMVEGANTDAQNFALLTGLRKQYPSLAVLVSVGGWLGSSGFSDVSLTAQSRKIIHPKRCRLPEEIRPRRPRCRLGISRHGRRRQSISRG